ncbi:MAG: hypothetical protein EOP83_02550 [Verrucomicrobiaceae bacterium]|nr:MAG: hypothetical protein EOP83_02550 [Verrucomicrobiaceae bacterium]
MLDLSAPIDRLADAKPAKHGLRRSLLLTGALLLLASVAIAIGHLAWQIFLIEQASSISAQTRYGSSHSHQSQYMPVMKHVRSIAPSLPLGLDEKGGSEETAKLLAENPDDLPLLQEHVIRRLRESDNRDGLTASERESIARLDPDNALWQLMLVPPALSKATGSSGRIYYRSGSSTVISEPDFQEALRLFSEAAAKPSYSDRASSLKRRQIEAFPPARSLTEDAIVMQFASFVSPPFGYYSGDLTSLARLHCDRLVAAKDKEALTKFYREWKQVSTVIISSHHSGESDYNDVFHQLAEMGKKLEDSFNQLGMAAEKADAQERHGILDKLRSNSATLPPEIMKARGVRLKSENRLPTNLTVEEVIPSRRTELSFFDRIQATFLAFLGLIFSGLVALETCRRSRIVKGMARGLTPLFRREDHVWIAALGLVLPWLWWWAVTRMTPLGWPDGDIDEGWVVMVWFLQSVATLTLAAVMLLQAARWRWNVRGGFLGLGGSLPWMGWGVAALTALSIPVAGSLRYFRSSMGSDETGLFLLGVSCMAACGLLWLLWHAIMTLFTPRSGALQPNLTMRAVLPWAMAGVATLLVGVAVSTAMEHYWFAKDPLFPAWTSKTQVNALKERAAEEVPKALREQ